MPGFGRNILKRLAEVLVRDPESSVNLETGEAELLRTLLGAPDRTEHQSGRASSSRCIATLSPATRSPATSPTVLRRLSRGTKMVATAIRDLQRARPGENEASQLAEIQGTLERLQALVDSYTSGSYGTCLRQYPLQNLKKVYNMTF